LMLTETVMGGVFVGLVHFFMKEKQDRTLVKFVSEYANRIGISFGSAQANANTEMKFVSDLDSLCSIANIRVEIEFVSLGAMPQLNRHEVSYKLQEFQDLNPSKFELSQRDEKDIESLIGHHNLPPLEHKRAVINEKYQLKMQCAQMVLMNAVRATKQVDKTHKVHTLESLYEAFESFISTMVNDEHSGVPFGFNYRQIHRLEISEAAMRAKIQYCKLLKEEKEAELSLCKIVEEIEHFNKEHPNLIIPDMPRQNVPPTIPSGNTENVPPTNQIPSGNTENVPPTNQIPSGYR